MKKKNLIIIIATIVLIALVTTLVLVLNKSDENASYTVKMSLVDDQSPARFLTVYKNDKKIDFKEVRYMDDVLLCRGTNPTIHFTELDEETELKVVLKNDKVVIAKIEKGDI